MPNFSTNKFSFRRSQLFCRLSSVLGYVDIDLDKKSFGTSEFGTMNAILNTIFLYIPAVISFPSLESVVISSILIF